MAKAIDITGQRFGKLVAVHNRFRNKQGRTVWLCKCDCGNETQVMAGALIAGQSRSCKCGLSQPKHGEHDTRLYRIHQAMKARCLYKSHPRYERYGGRGITICKEWVNDYAAFAAWSKANGYSDGLQIDRINNDGNYEPGNCRWTTAAVNMANRSCSRR